jgi:hypothetical protein
MNMAKIFMQIFKIENFNNAREGFPFLNVFEKEIGL